MNSASVYKAQLLDMIASLYELPVPPMKVNIYFNRHGMFEYTVEWE